MSCGKCGGLILGIFEEGALYRCAICGRRGLTRTEVEAIPQEREHMASAQQLSEEQGRDEPAAQGEPRRRRRGPPSKETREKISRSLTGKRKRGRPRKSVPLLEAEHGGVVNEAGQGGAPSPIEAVRGIEALIEKLQDRRARLATQLDDLDQKIEQLREAKGVVVTVAST
ncbi:hypothetical protein [Candidatus Nitrospira bockiana]